jgi:hypothetical protein
MLFLISVGEEQKGQYLGLIRGVGRLNSKRQRFLHLIVPASMLVLLLFAQTALVNANGVQKYYLRIVSPYGTTVGQGWYTANTYAYASLTVGIVDQGNGTRRVFAYWSYSASGTNYTKSRPILMNCNKTAVANWKTQYVATFKQKGLDSSASSMIVNVNSTGKLFFQLPYAFWVDSGAKIVYSYYNVSSSTVGKRFILVNVTGPTSPKTVWAPICVTGNYKTQYLLTVNTNPPDLSPQPTRSLPGEPQTTSSWWYDANTTVLLTARQVDNYTFSHWDIDGTSQGDAVNPISVLMNVAHNATANYQIIPLPPKPVGGFSYSLAREGSASSYEVGPPLLMLLGIVLLAARRKSKRLPVHT